jgi:hypothetical protein
MIINGEPSKLLEALIVAAPFVIGALIIWLDGERKVKK